MASGKALVREAAIAFNKTEKYVAVASVAVPLTPKMYQVTEHMAEHLRGFTRMVNPARSKERLMRKLQSFLLLCRNLL